MSFDATKVGSVTVSGEVFYAPTGTTLPTDTSTALNVAFLGTGYVSEDGVSEVSDISRDSIKAMGGEVVRETITEAKFSLEFTLIETNKNGVEAYYGATVTQTSAHGSYDIDVAATLGRKAWAVHIIDGAEKTRYAVAEGELFKGDGVTYAAGEAVAYPCVLTCYTKPKKYDTRLKTP